MIKARRWRRGGRRNGVAVSPPGGLRLALRVEGHRAVLLAGVVEEAYLVYAALQQLAPVFAKPALGVPLAGEDGLLQARTAHHGAIRLFVPPGPGHCAGPPSRACVMRD